MRRKQIHTLAFDLFELMRKDFGYPQAQSVQYTEFPHADFYKAILPLKSPGYVQSIVRKNNPGSKLPTSYLNSVDDFLVKNRVSGSIVLLYGATKYNKHCSLRVSDICAQPPPRIVEVDAGKITKSGMFCPHILYKEYKVTALVAGIVDVFHKHYRHLLLSGDYLTDEVEYIEAEDERYKDLTSVADSTVEYLETTAVKQK